MFNAIRRAAALPQLPEPTMAIFLSAASNRSGSNDESMTKRHFATILGRLPARNYHNPRALLLRLQMVFPRKQIIFMP